MDLRAIAKREERERDGVWIKLNTGVPDDPAEVLVIGLDAPKYSQTLYMRMLPLRNKYGSKEVPDHEMDAVIAEVMAEIVLLNWRGIELDGKPFEFSKQAAAEWLKSSTHFKDMVSAAAMKAARLLNDQFAEDVAALKKASAPVSTPPKTAKKSRG